MPTPTATAAICSGVRAKRRAVAAGIISREVMISAPTNFIATPIVRAVTSINSSLTRCSFTPSTNARSGLMVIASRFRHCQSRMPITITTPVAMAIRSCGVTASRSPNRYAIRSTRTLDIRLTTTSPRDSALCAMMPSRVSIARCGRFSSHTSPPASSRVTAITA